MVARIARKVCREWKDQVEWRMMRDSNDFSFSKTDRLPKFVSSSRKDNNVSDGYRLQRGS